MSSYDSSNPEHRARARRYIEAQRQRVREEIILPLLAQPCADCERSFPHYVMEFDHVPERGPKLFSVGNTSHWHNRERLVAEIAKCDVVCANCHRTRTWQRAHP